MHNNDSDRNKNNNNNREKKKTTKNEAEATRPKNSIRIDIFRMLCCIDNMMMMKMMNLFERRELARNRLAHFSTFLIFFNLRRRMKYVILVIIVNVLIFFSIMMNYIFLIRV